MADELLGLLRAHATPQGGLAKILEGGKRRYQAILCHIGTNQNGQHLTLEEAKSAAKIFADEFAQVPPKSFPIRMTFGKIVKPQDGHPTTVKEIIGKAVGIEVIEGQDARVEYIGEVYDTTEDTRHAFQVIHDGFYDYDSFEVGYAFGECSACHQEFKTPKQICRHLALSGGCPVGTKEAHFTMHGVRFMGVSMLDRAGADPKAKVIKAVAHLAQQEETMTDEELKAQAAKSAELEELQAQIATLKADLDTATNALKKADQELATFHAKARKERCEKIVVAKVQKTGKVFKDEAEKTAELARLEALPDAKLDAYEEVLAETPEPPVPPAAPVIKGTATQQEPDAAGDPDSTSKIQAVLKNYQAAKNAGGR